jgi:hypothetical protein
MGAAEIELHHRQIIIYSNIITYGNAADAAITENIREEIEAMWNEPKAVLKLDGLLFEVVFRINAWHQPQITPLDIYRNLDPRHNYFRIEEFAHGNISFVDGLKCNSGYFKLENLYKGSTTAAHEYGHTLGLDHPQILDIRGEGIPGIMYPRGTLVDPQFQYDPSKPAGITGGTMHPIYRKVKQEDIDALKLHRLQFHHGKAILGEFTNIWHPDHATLSPEEFMGPPVAG